jgi:hypothetical protein
LINYSIASEVEKMFQCFNVKSESLIKNWKMHASCAGRAAWNRRVVSGFEMTELGSSASPV